MAVLRHQRIGLAAEPKQVERAVRVRPAAEQRGCEAAIHLQHGTGLRFFADLQMRGNFVRSFAYVEHAITVLHAASEDEAVEAARSVARSNLFKAAVYGKDPNWGRVLASIGTTQAAFDPADLDVAMNGVWVCRNSEPFEPPEKVVFEGREVSVTVAQGQPRRVV